MYQSAKTRPAHQVVFCRSEADSQQSTREIGLLFEKMMELRNLYEGIRDLQKSASNKSAFKVSTLDLEKEMEGFDEEERYLFQLFRGIESVILLHNKEGSGKRT